MLGYWDNSWAGGCSVLSCRTCTIPFNTHSANDFSNYSKIITLTVHHLSICCRWKSEFLEIVARDLDLKNVISVMWTQDADDEHDIITIKLQYKLHSSNQALILVHV